MKKNIILIIIAVTLVGCIDFTSPDRYKNQLYYLTGLLIKGENINLENPILIGKTIPADGGILEDMIIFDAEVTVTEFSPENQEQDFTQLTLMVDSVTGKIGYVDQNSVLLIKSGYRYEIQAVINQQDTLFASTVVPDAITILPDPTGYTDDPEAEPYPEMVYDNIDRDHPILIQTESNEVFPLHAEFYCLEEWYNAEWIRPFDSDNPEDEEEYENFADGSPRKIVTFYTFQPEDNLVNYQFYKSAFVFYGRYEVTINALDDNYFQYLYKPEGFNHGGINGGIGYFGSVCGKKMYTRIVEED